MKRDYELAFILSPEASEEETRAIMDRVEQVVTTHDGQVVKVNQWGRRRLAYPIERHRDGIYVFIDMILTPESVSELERTLKVSEIVLRHMVKRRDPKAVQKEREEREAREARAAAAPVAVATQATEAEEPAPANEEVEETPVLSEEDLQDVPPAIEEEALEA
ncbi:MAG TPA: 30S ribosomal protein S6 [Ktedonobacteraceae bacterium]|nr:30S ribosomal protein S6 [Ktedonobacteraceae bacterium]